MEPPFVVPEKASTAGRPGRDESAMGSFMHPGHIGDRVLVVRLNEAGVVAEEARGYLWVRRDGRPGLYPCLPCELRWLARA